MNHKRTWLRTVGRILLTGLLLSAVFAPITSDYVLAEGLGGGQPITPPCDTCGVGSVAPGGTDPVQGTISQFELFLLTMPVTGI